MAETGSSGSSITASVDRTGLYGNVTDGLAVNGFGGGTIDVAVTDSVAANNGVGFEALPGTASNSVNLLLTHSSVIGNTLGLKVSSSGAGLAPNAMLWLAQTTLTGNVSSYTINGNAIIYSFGDNYFAAAKSGNTGTLTTVSRQ